MEHPLAYVDEAVHLVRDGLGGGAVASEDLAGVRYAPVALSDERLPPGPRQGLPQLVDEPEVLDRGEYPHSFGKALQGPAGHVPEADVRARLDVQHVGVVAHGRYAGVPVVHQRIGPSPVVEQVAGAVAGAPDDEDGRSGLSRDVIRNLRGPDLQALGKLDGDGGVAPVAYPFGYFFEFEIEHRAFT